MSANARIVTADITIAWGEPGCTSYFAAMSRNMLPSQSSALVAMRSGLTDSLAQQNAAVTALPPNETAYSDATDFSSPCGM